MSKLKVVVIGMGKMGKIRYDTLNRHGGFEIAAICDIKSENLRGYDCPVYENWEACLEKNKFDAGVVCTYNNAIPDIVCRALDMGLHVFAEKPPGKDLNDAVRMKQAAEKSGKILKFGFNHRYHNSVIEAKTLIDSRLLGDIVCARGVYGKSGSATFTREWRNMPDISGGGILLDQGIHMLDLLLYFLGDFSSVNSEVSTLAWHDIPTEDSAFAILKTSDGKIASLHSSAVQWKHKFELEIVCTEGYIVLDGLLTATKSYGEELITYYRKDLEMATGKQGNPLEHTLCFNADDSWNYEMDEFFAAITRQTPLKNGTPDDAVNVMRLIEKIYAGNCFSEKK